MSLLILLFDLICFESFSEIGMIRLGPPQKRLLPRAVHPGPQTTDKIVRVSHYFSLQDHLQQSVLDCRKTAINLKKW